MRQSNKQTFAQATNRQLMSTDFYDALIWEQIESDVELPPIFFTTAESERLTGRISRRRVH